MNTTNKPARKLLAVHRLAIFLRSKESRTYPLDTTTRLVMFALASFFYYDNVCNPSYPNLINFCNLDKRTIDDRLDMLESLGLILIKKKNGAKNVYYWNIPDVSWEEVYGKKYKKPGTSSVPGSILTLSVDNTVRKLKLV